MSAPRIDALTGADGAPIVSLSGRWTLTAIGPGSKAMLGRLASVDARAAWDGRQIEQLDSAGAVLLWRAWGRRLPAGLQVSADHRRIFERIAAADRREPLVAAPSSAFDWLAKIGGYMIGFASHLVDFLALVGQATLDLARVIRHPGELPSREISANLYKSADTGMARTPLL